MRLLIASDIHGSLAAMKRLRAAAERLTPDMLVLLGDILYHGPRNPLPEEYAPAEVAALFREWLAEQALPLMCVRGNCDAEVDSMLLPFPLAENAWLFADGARIFAVHGHNLPAGGAFPGLAPGFILGSIHGFIQLSGHTHIPRAEEQNGIRFWNPGSTSLPKGGFPQSYGVIENGAFSVLAFADDAVLMRDAVPAAGQVGA